MKNLSGLVVCGGKSARMGKDKSILDYHGIPQRNYIFNLLTKFCDDVYLSLNQSQTEDKLPFIRDADEFKDCGPMSALLSAWKKYPETSWLAIGCDYPFVDEKIISLLISNRSGCACSFVLRNKKDFEPVLAIYESSLYPSMIASFNNKNYSLNALLKSINATAVEYDSETDLLNVNTIDDFTTANELINTQRHRKF